MEEAELEEGEALSYHGEVENSTIDPESALSYIEEKLQNVLGHFQKDFEGGVSAENLGAKFGGYGSFLPTYQRSPSWSHKKGSTEVHNYDSPKSPKKFQSEDQRQNLLATSGASPIARLCDASQSTMPMVNSLTGNMHFPFRHVDDSSFKCGVIEKSSNPPDNRTLKLRIKVGSENLSNQKNAEIYSGLGLEVSPSSSWDDSPATGERLSSDLLDVQEQSPICILQIMASFFASHLLSPLSEDLIDLPEKQNLGSKSDSKLVNMASTEISAMLGNGSGFGRRDQKVKGLKNSLSSDKNHLSEEFNNERNYGNRNNSVTQKEKETEMDTFVCDELVSNALKLPFLSNSQCAISDTTKGFSRAKIVPLNASKTGVKVETSNGVTEKKHLDSESAQDIERIEKLGESQGPTGKILESKKGDLVGSLEACAKDDEHEVEKSHTSNQSVSNASKGRKTPSAIQTEPTKQFVRCEEGLQLASEKSSSGGLKKPKEVSRIGSQGLNINPSLSPKNGKRSDATANRQVSKNESLDFQKDRKIHRDTHLKEIFGELVSEGNGSILRDSVRLKDPELVGKKSTSECLSKEKSNGKISEKPHPSEKEFMLASHVATPVNGPSSEAPAVVAPVVNEDWVSCDKCKKWRLLPLGTDPKSLPKKWLCRMLTWLPGMNRCIISEEETTSTLRALYHTSDFGSVPDSMRQHNQHHISAETFVAGTTIGAQFPGQEHQNVSVLSETTSEKKKHTMTHSENSTDIDGSIHSSNSRKNLSTSGKNRKSQTRNDCSLNSSGNQNIHRSNNEIEKQNSKIKEESLLRCSDTGTNQSNLNIRTTLDSDVEGSRASKRIKEDAHSEDEKRSYENYGASLKVDSMSNNHLSNNTSGSDGHTHPKGISSSVDKKENMGGLNSEVQVPGTSDDDLMQSGKFADRDSAKKRKVKDHQTSEIQAKPHSSLEQNYQNIDDFVDEKWGTDRSKKKKARLSESEGKDTSGSKSRTVINGNDRNMHEQCNAPHLNRSQAEDCLKSERCVVQPSVAANSSSSKVSSSRKNQIDFHEVKGSPVESVSSSPLRLHNTDKVRSITKNLVKDDFHDSYSLSDTNSRRFSGVENGGTRWTGMVKKDAALNVDDHVPDICSDALYQSTLGKIGENTISKHAQNTVSHLKKSVKELSSCSKEKAQTSRSDLDNNEIKASGSSHDHFDHTRMCKEKTKSRRNKFNDPSGTPGMTEKLNCKKYNEGGTSNESSKEQNQIKFRDRDGLDFAKNQDENHNFLQECHDEKLRKKSCLGKANGNGVVHSLPPSSRVRREKVASFQHVSGTEKENGVNVSSVDTLQNGDASKDQSKMSENQNCQPSSLRHSTLNPRKVRDVGASSPVRKESASHAANNALKEAKDLKHLADRLKNSGSTESNGFYFEAALKFLYGASLLEVGTSEGSKHNDLMHSMHIYSSTAKLCEFCAHEFEKSKNMAAAALAYKCVEVAYMRVVYSSHSNASKDRNELQTALRIVPPGESPFSSASDDDNLNQATADKPATLAKVMGSPQVSGSHTISSQKRSGFIRLLNFAQDVHLAMEASRKSRNTFTSAISKLRETEICALKKALDFNFQDVDGLLHLVRVSMEAINR